MELAAAQCNFLLMNVEIIHDDFWAWHFEIHGNFLVKSAHRMLTETKNEREAWLEERQLEWLQ
jgi:hypothetical protein